jgi:spermidine synthase
VKKSTMVIILYLMFFLSGAAGLVYQVLWARLFGLVFGNTVFASSTVLAAFMAGLAIGSISFGRYISRHKLQNGLKMYFFMELLVGVFGMLMPSIANLLGHAYAGLYQSVHPSFVTLTVFRFLLSFLVMAIPCVFMGATLPVLSAVITMNDPVRKNVVGRLYGINTIGAVAGCMSAGFLFVGRLGIGRTSLLAAAFNIFVAALSLVLSKKQMTDKVDVAKHSPSPFKSKGGHRIPQKKESAEPYMKKQPGPIIQNEKKQPGPIIPNGKKRLGRVLLIVYALSGFAAMSLEVAWTKAMVWIMAMDSYAFAAMLSVILAGIGFGSLLHMLVAKKIKNEKGLLVIIQFLIGATVLLSIVVIQNSMALKSGLQTAMNGIGALSFIYTVVSPVTISQLLLSAFVLLLPSVLMGFAFPVVARLYIGVNGEVGEGVGTIYAANTFGAIAGALFTGFVLMPAIGLLPAIAVMAGIYFVNAFLLLAMSSAFTRETAWKSVGMAAVAVLLLLTTNCSSVDFIQTTLNSQEGDSGESLLYFKENATGDVLVKESAAYGHEMVIDGVQVASDGDFDLHSHLYPAHLISLLKKDPEDILVIAFGCGGTGGSILKYDEVDKLDVVEICEGVVNPAKEFFSLMNSNVFENPKLNLIIQDGKNYVRMTDKFYDIIYSGPIHPQSNQGSAALYTKEYFQDCKSRLKSDGFQCLWLPMHMSSPEDFKTIVKTYMDVYPYVSMWILPQTNTSVAHPHLIGSMQPIYPDYQLIGEKLKRPGIQDDLKRLNETAFSEPHEFISQFAMGEEALGKFIAGTSAVNSDDLPVVEFYERPADYLAATAASKAELLSETAKYMENPYPYVLNVPADEKDELKKQLDRLYEGNRHLILGHFYLTAKSIISMNVDVNIRDDYRKAYDLIPESEYLMRFFIENPSD